jgi:DNA-nicking Smr family endonuclease
MNFEDILNKWEENNGIVYDKDKEAVNTNINPQERRTRLRNKKPDAQLDIHGLTRDEAWQALENFFNDSKGKGLEKILVIHGKGNHSKGEAVLKRIVMEFIEHCSFAGESGRGKAAVGGEGATWVLLK